MGNKKPILLLGAGGHACVLKDILDLLEWPIKGYSAHEPATRKSLESILYLGMDDDWIQTVTPSDVWLVNGVGAVSPEGNLRREAIFVKYKDLGFSFMNVVHPSAIIAQSVFLDEGIQIMPGVVIQSNVSIGTNVIINTSSSIDHDCVLEKSVHIAPGVTLSGNVKIGAFSHIGVGATIIQNIAVKESTLLRAGTTLIKES